MTNIILLAAGNSRRFVSEEGAQKSKLLQQIGGKPLYRYSFDVWNQAANSCGGCRVFVVTRQPEILEAAEAFGFTPVSSPESEKGISYSIRAGLGAAGSGGADSRYLFAVTDQPFLRAETLLRFLHEAVRASYACLSWQGELYNPVSFPAEAIPELLALSGDQGGKRVLRAHLSDCVRVPAAGAEEVMDIDTLEDIRRLDALNFS